MGITGMPRLASLTLTVTERCNLRCSYCYVPFERGQVMQPEVVDRAIELLAQHADDPETTLSFFGGEPMLARDLCRRAVDGASRALDGKRRLRVLIPTNGLELDDETLAWCRDEDVELALSIDGGAREHERRFAGGQPAAERLLPRVPEVLSQLPRSRVIARMTVTPANVGRLATNVRTLARMGFRRIIYLLAYEEAWDDAAIAAWGREHRRLGTWLVGAFGAGANVPDLPGWRAIEERILLGGKRRPCGAGYRIAAVSTDGGLYPCYRLVFRSDDAGVRLGDVHNGFTQHEALARFANFDPDHVRPEDGDCNTCSARDGCTHACPALGWTMLGDVSAVPRIACRLMREQVEAIRPYAALWHRSARRSHVRLVTALMAAAATVIGATPACGSSTSDTRTGDAATDHANGYGGGGGVCAAGGVAYDGGSGYAGTGGYGGGGGLCPYTGGTGGGGGLCDYGGAGGVGGYGGGGGLCPGGGAGGDSGYGGGGLCMAGGDSGYGGGGGLCAFSGGMSGESDAAPDVEASGGWGGAGLCPYLADGGGIC